MRQTSVRGNPIWTITAGGSGPAQVITNPITVANGSVWANPPAGSAWVSTTTANSLPPTTYSLSYTFNNSASAVLTFRALADNQLRVYINNAVSPVFTFVGLLAGDFSNLPTLQTINLAAGPTTIRLDVVNTGGFSGVLFAGDVSDVPEPSTFAAAALGVVAMGWRLRQRRAPKST